MSTAPDLSPEKRQWLAAIPKAVRSASELDAQEARDRGTTSPQPLKAVDAVAHLAALAAPKRETHGAFTLLQHWEGVVQAVSDDSFTATLRDLTEPSNPSEVVELYLEDVARDDRQLVQPGAVFYWSVGYEDTHRGWERKSFIHFRRLPAWSRREMARVDEEARELASYFGIPNDSASRPDR